MLVGDYGFIRSSHDSKADLQTVLILRVLPYKLNFATIVPVKGIDQLVAARVARFIREAGLVHFAYRSDRELAITALLEEAIRISGRRGSPTASDAVPDHVDFPVAPVDDDEPDAPTEVPKTPQPEGAMVAVPELTHPGESQSNGLAERAVETVVDHTRTLILALETHVKIHIPAQHAVMAWAVEHSAYLLNKYLLGSDGHTAYGRLHGKETSERLCEFGERVLWFVPKAIRSKLDQRWRYGFFWGDLLPPTRTLLGCPTATW